MATAGKNGEKKSAKTVNFQVIQAEEQAFLRSKQDFSKESRARPKNAFKLFSNRRNLTGMF